MLKGLFMAAIVLLGLLISSVADLINWSTKPKAECKVNKIIKSEEIINNKGKSEGVKSTYSLTILSGTEKWTTEYTGSNLAVGETYSVRVNKKDKSVEFINFIGERALALASSIGMIVAIVALGFSIFGLVAGNYSTVQGSQVALIIILAVAALNVIPGIIAYRKKKSFWTFYLSGFLITPIATIIIAVLTKELPDCPESQFIFSTNNSKGNPSSNNKSSKVTTPKKPNPQKNILSLEPKYNVQKDETFWNQLKEKVASVEKTEFSKIIEVASKCKLISASNRRIFVDINQNASSLLVFMEIQKLLSSMIYLSVSKQVKNFDENDSNNLIAMINVSDDNSSEEYLNKLKNLIDDFSQKIPGSAFEKTSKSNSKMYALAATHYLIYAKRNNRFGDFSEVEELYLSNDNPLDLLTDVFKEAFININKNISETLKKYSIETSDVNHDSKEKLSVIEKEKEIQSDVVIEEFSTLEKMDITPVYCRKCGAKLVGDSLFCHKCGTKIITLEE